MLPEGEDDRILRAASTLLQREVADLTILGNEAAIRARATELGLDISAAAVIDPKDGELHERFAARVHRDAQAQGHDRRARPRDRRLGVATSAR